MRKWLGVWGLVFFLLPAAALAAEEFAASFRLRGGYDSNPLMAPQGHGSPLIAWDGVAAYGRKVGGWTAGVTGEASVVRYREEGFEPLQNYRLRLRLANGSENALSFDATTALSHFSSYDTQSSSAKQRVHLQWTGGAWRPFVAGDLTLASLNELNVLLGDFLPEPLRYLRGTLTPGVAYTNENAEIGFSLALSRTRYEDEFDLFGFRRDNDRLQPTLFAKFDHGAVQAAGSISYLLVRSEDVDFTDVETMLFDVSLSATWRGWSGEIAIARTAEDTSFPISPVTINTAAQARLARAIDRQTSAGIFARMLNREYWDSPFHSRIRAAGIEVKREIADDLLLAGEIGFAKSLLLSGAEAEGVVASVALTRRFGAAAQK